MKLSKLLLAALGATVLFSTVASATTLSISSQAVNIVWTRLNFRGGLGTVECEVMLNSTYHSRVISKTPGSLLGYVTAANVNRCSRGGATVLRETLPWHFKYDSFTGTLPEIATMKTRFEDPIRITEPVFGISCLIKASPREPMFLTYERSPATHALTSVTVGGTIRCGGSTTMTLEGTTILLTANTTLTLI